MSCPAYSIGKSHYPDETMRSRPGPGDYETIRVPKIPSYSFSKSPRKIHDFYKVPGPGVYNPNSQLRSPGFTLSRSPRILSNVRNFSPGPGEYDYVASKLKYQYSISKARSRSYANNDSPGPGYYSPNITPSIERSPKVLFQKDTRMPRSYNSNPAPGQYELPDVYSHKGFTIPKAKIKEKDWVSPGPGGYEIPNGIGRYV